MVRNLAKARLREGGTVIGTMVSEMRTEEVAYVLAAAGFDFLVIDTKFASASMETVQCISRAARSAGIAPLVRVPEISYSAITRVLDAGALGLMVPNVESSADAREIVRCAKYPPEGERGYGLRAAVLDYTDPYMTSVPDAMAWSNQEIMIMALIESRKALANADEIASTPGLDVLLAGPADLSIRLGVPGDRLHPLVKEAYARVVAAASAHGLVAGIHPSIYAVVEYGRDIGMRCLMYSADVRLLLAAGREAVTRLRGNS